MEYFSDQTNGSSVRNINEIPSNVWGGIVVTINSHISSGSFGKHFPICCPDGADIIGVDENAFKLALTSEIPGIEYPFITEKPRDDWWPSPNIPFTPDYLLILDLIQFCHEHIASPIQDRHHRFFDHYHLSFDVEAGRKEFRNKINRIFSRNRISYEIQSNGNIIRLAPTVLSEVLHSAHFKTKDSILNRMLEDSRTKFLNPDENVRRESLERLWDAWERIKTILDSDKKKSIGMLLDKCSDEPKLRGLLEIEAKTLTEIGNGFHIRHSEVNQTKIQRGTQIDYIFHRLFSLMLLAIKSLA